MVSHTNIKEFWTEQEDVTSCKWYKEDSTRYYQCFVQTNGQS